MGWHKPCYHLAASFLAAPALRLGGFAGDGQRIKEKERTHRIQVMGAKGARKVQGALLTFYKEI